ncbi:MAG: hypothetical protein IRY99_13550 [Isosphaeraceae bacterium]|nr:hypothetical protein [Isosphaeraceae bacterium]
MPNPRSRPPAAPGPQQAGIPDAQARALDRRQALDEQQRAFRNSVPKPHFGRPRPPA